MTDRRRENPRRTREQRRGGGVRQLAWRAITNPYPPIAPLAEDQVEAVHNASMRILEEIGMDFLHPEALDILSAGGAEVTPGTHRVRLDRDMVAATIASAPASFKLHARNPAHDITIGEDHITFASVGNPPYASDLDRGRRAANFEDYLNFVRLTQACNIVHLFGGYPVEAIDLPPSTRHLDCLAAFVTLSDKVFHAYSLGRQRICDGIEIARIGRGISTNQMRAEPSLHTVVNTSSPLRLDAPMIEGVIEMARMNQPVVATPFSLAGAMAPASLAGALAQQNAEALATIVLAQLVSPGAPVVYGGFTSNVDMRSGSPAFGTPEFTRAALAGGQLARRYGLPYRSSNANASKAVDAQAAYESQMSLWGAVMGHANVVVHAAGWLEGGLVASFEKFIVDVEMLQMMAVILEGITVDESELAFEAIAEVGPGGHFFGAAHTLERFGSAFYTPLVSDWTIYENWVDAGAETAERRANRIWKQVRADFTPPPLPDDRAEELADFVARRTKEGGAPSLD